MLTDFETVHSCKQYQKVYNIFLLYVTEMNLNFDHCPRGCHVIFSGECYDRSITVTRTIAIKIDIQIIN